MNARARGSCEIGGGSDGSHAAGEQEPASVDGRDRRRRARPGEPQAALTLGAGRIGRIGKVGGPDAAA